MSDGAFKLPRPPHVAIACVLLLPGLAGCDQPAPTEASPAVSVTPLAVPFDEDERRTIASLSPLPALPPDPTNAVADDPAAARLGQTLFFDTRFSADGSVSCATCHDPALAFTDGKRLGEAIGVMDRHTPGLANVGYNRWFFWDGRADTLWAQALDPLETQIEHGATRTQCARIIAEDPKLRALYESIFGAGTLAAIGDPATLPDAARPVRGEPDHPHQRAWDGISDERRRAIDAVFVNMGKTLAAYQRRLVSRDAPFDRFARGLASGDQDLIAALEPAAQRGLKLFIGRADCIRCHFGPTFSDGEFHSTGVPPLAGGELYDAGRYTGIERLLANPFNAAGAHSDATGEAGRAAAAKVTSIVRSTESWGQFKTPTLRDVARTDPYMHQGQFATLEDVLHHYSTLEDAVLPGHHQEQLLQPLDLTGREIGELAAFLETLTGAPLDEALLRPPPAPREGPRAERRATDAEGS